MSKQATGKTFGRADIGGFRYSRNPPDLIGPSAPTIVQAPVPGTTSIVASWVNGIDAQSGIASSYAEISPFGAGVWTRSVVPWPGSSYTFTGLTSSSPYQIRIANVDASANSNVSAYSAIQTVSTTGSAADLEPGTIALAVSAVVTDEGTPFSAAVTRTGAGISSPGVEADWSISGITQGAPSPGNGTLSWAAGENGPKFIASTAGQVTTNQQGTIRLVAIRQLSGNIAPTLGASSATLTIASTDATGIKWNPGFYMGTQNPTYADDRNLANQIAEQNLVLSSGVNCLGWKGRYKPAIFGNTPGVFDLSKIFRDLNRLRSMSPRKRLIIQIQGAEFGITDYTRLLPAYVYNDSAYGASPTAGKYGFWTMNGQTAVSIAWWRPAVMDWIIAAFQAMAATVNSATGLTMEQDPYFEQTNFAETSTQVDPGDATFTSNARVVQYKRLIDAINIAWPSTLHVCANNFAGSQALSQDLTNYCSTHRTAQGSPDTLAVGQGSMTWGQKAALGAAQSDPAFSGPDLRGIIAMVSDTQGPEISNPARYTMYTPHSFFSMVDSVLQQAHMIITAVSRGVTANPIPAYPADGVNTGSSPGNWNSFLQVINGNTLAHIQKPTSLLGGTTTASAVFSISTGTLSLHGSGFGTKAIAAPHRFFPLNDANGTDCMAIAGLDSTGATISMEQYNADGAVPRAVVATSDAPVGKALVTSFTVPADNGGWTPAMGSFLPAGSNEAFGSMLLKIEHNGAVLSHLAQWKAPRSGVFGANPHSDGNNNYNASGVKVHGEFFVDPAGTVSSLSGFAPIFNDSSNVAHDYTNGSPNEVNGWSSFRPGYNMFSGWHCWQYWYYAGTIGNSDGFMYWWCDGALVGKLTGKAVRLIGSTANPIQQLQYLTGLQNLDARTYTMSVARPYLDTTCARVEYINNSTYAAATSFITVRPYAWADADILANQAAPVTGYNYVAITNSSGVSQVYPLQVIP